MSRAGRMAWNWDSVVLQLSMTRVCRLPSTLSGRALGRLGLNPSLHEDVGVKQVLELTGAQTLRRMLQFCFHQ